MVMELVRRLPPAHDMYTVEPCAGAAASRDQLMHHAGAAVTGHLLVPATLTEEPGINAIRQLQGEC